MVIPHGVPLPDRNQLEAKLARPPGEPLQLVAATRLHEDAKRPWDYLAIARELVRRGLKFHLAILGGGPCLEPMRQAVAAENLAGFVELTGAVARGDVLRRLLAADVLLAAADREAYGLSIAEALACGCAVVSSDLPGAVAEMVRDDATGFRAPVGNVAAFADAIARLCRDPGRLRRLGAEGARAVAESRSESAMAVAYARVIRQAAPRIARRTWVPPAELADTPARALAAKKGFWHTAIGSGR